MSSPREAADPPRRPPDREAVVWVAEQRRLFQRVLDALGRGHIPFAVAGAFAFQHYTGIERFTKDLDIFLPAERVAVALTLCQTAGLVTEVTDPVWLAKAWAGEFYVDLISGMSNGAYWVTQEWIERAHWGEVLGRRHRLLAPEEMILSKLFVTRRDRFDGSEICHLLYRAGSRLDWTHMLRAAGGHWPMLHWHLMLFRYVYPAAARSVIPAPVWKELERRQRDADRQPAPEGFRGNLIDPIQFAVDMQAWGLHPIEERG